MCTDTIEIKDGQILHIDLNDHSFDDEGRKAAKPKRKRDVRGPDLPSRGSRPIREHHRRDESKILPHIRYGLNFDKCMSYVRCLALILILLNVLRPLFCALPLA